VLALSSNLILDIVPTASGAWYLPDAASGRLVAVDAFGPGADALRGFGVAMGEPVTGWVAASRQMVVNSAATLDLRERAALAQPPLTTCMSVPLIMGTSLAGVLTDAATRTPSTSSVDAAADDRAAHRRGDSHRRQASAAKATPPATPSLARRQAPARLDSLRSLLSSRHVTRLCCEFDSTLPSGSEPRHAIAVGRRTTPSSSCRHERQVELPKCTPRGQFQSLREVLDFSRAPCPAPA
jgi:hypothetical protein